MESFLGWVGKLKPGFGKSGVPLRHHRPTAYNFPTQPKKDELCYDWISMKGKTGGKGGGGKEKVSLWANITSILKHFTAEERSENYEKV